MSTLPPCTALLMPKRGPTLRDRWQVSTHINSTLIYWNSRPLLDPQPPRSISLQVWWSGSVKEGQCCEFYIIAINVEGSGISSECIGSPTLIHDFNYCCLVSGLNMGQKLRSLGIKHVRVRINGFNAARVSTVKGITQVNKPTVVFFLWFCYFIGTGLCKL